MRGEKAAKAALAAASLLLALGAAEVTLRWADRRKRVTNDASTYTRVVGERRIHAANASYAEEFPKIGAYHRKSNPINYHTDQFGGRWIAPGPRRLNSPVGIVLGDSFTYGFGLQYEDAYAYRLEQLLAEKGTSVSLVNLAQPAAASERCLAIYAEHADAVPHDVVLYGLHLNDLISFWTSQPLKPPKRGPALFRRSALWRFAVARIDAAFHRDARVREIASRAHRGEPFYRENFDAIVALDRLARKKGKRLVVVVLPLLLDLRQGTFDNTYRTIVSDLTNSGVDAIDLSHVLGRTDEASYWLFSFDQHPNAVANARFAEALVEPFSVRLRGEKKAPADKSAEAK